MRFSAHARPAGPAPIIETAWVEKFSTYFFGFHPSARALSVIYFSIWPIVTASYPVFKVQAPSQSFSCGQILPHISGKEFVSWHKSAAS